MKNKRGFSLLEFLFVIAVLIVAMSISLQLFVTLNKNYMILVAYLSSYLKGREAIDIISKDCRIAIRVTDDYAGYTTSDDCLILKVPSIDASRNIIDVNKEFDYIIYRISGEDLWKTVIPGINSSRASYDGIFKKSMDSLYVTHNGIPLSAIEHKSIITSLTLRASVVEIVLGKEYRVTPGTTVKLMNYEWEFVR